MSNTNTDILLAGAIAAFSVDLLVYPLDTLKTRLQSPDYKRIYINASTNTANRAVLLRGLYQGVGSVIIATLPSSGAFFTTYEGIKSLLTKHTPHFTSSSSSSFSTSPLIPQPLIHATASSIAELVSCFILTPAEVLKQNAQMVNQKPSTTSTSSPINSLSTAAQHPAATTQTAMKETPTIQVLRKFKSNPTNLWRGYTALAARNLPFTAMQFPMFEHLKKTIQTYRRSKGKSTDSLLETGIITAVSAGSAGSVAAVLTTPIDVIKTRIMLSASDNQATKSPHVVKELEANGNDAKAEVARAKQGSKGNRPSSWAIGSEVVRSEGFRGLWRGGLLRGLWTALGSGLYLGVYESGRTWLGERRDGRADGDSVV
ncbi:MAG: hypothetical protein M1835_005361 [Candelina submexicana]|nr:MAG: hypothetical protein M1835_005361 [Candelina submexicana]